MKNINKNIMDIYRNRFSIKGEKEYDGANISFMKIPVPFHINL